MVAGLSMLGSVVDSNLCPCLCIDSLSLSNANFRGRPELGLYSRSEGRKKWRKLSTSFVDTWDDWRLSGRFRSRIVRGRGFSRKITTPVIVDELAGQYEDSFEDVKLQILNYFTYKAVRTVLHQLYEMNPPDYRWLYNFVTMNKPGDGKRFLRPLAKERQDLAERVMVTRLSLYSKWAKKCDHAKIYEEISDQNLALMRERLMETVIWPFDDTNTERIG